MNDAYKRLEKILLLEIKRNYDDMAVFGGLSKLATTYEEEARKGFLDSDDSPKIINLLKEYGNVSIFKRREIIEQINNMIRIPQDNRYSYNTSDGLQAGNYSVKRVADKPSEKYSPTNLKSNVTTKRTLNLEIKSSLTSIPAIGKSREKALIDSGINSIEDLIYHFPRKYNDYSKLRTIKQLIFGEQVTIIATVKNVTTRRTKNRNVQITEVIVEDGSGSLRVSFFNQPYLQFQIKKDVRLALKGKVEMYLGRFILNSPEWDIVDEELDTFQGISPIYRLPAGFSQKAFIKIIRNTLEIWGNQIHDYLPKNSELLADLPNLQEAILTLHQPKDFDSLKAAMNRISFDQIFFLQMGVLGQKENWNRKPADRYAISDTFQSSLLKRIPFPLTLSQLSTLNAIKKDLSSGSPMNRLLQGDVGSGKTIVALLAAAYIFSRNDTQCTMMAPTGILAEQHYINSLKFFNENQLVTSEQIRLLLGDTPQSEKEEIRRKLENGEIRLIIGTHSLIEDTITFRNLQLAVIDEQHRFGVEQRKLLNTKGARAHLLAMTATPIPRSLALTVYGDLDLSIMKEMPAGRQKITTYIVDPKNRKEVYKVISDKVAQGQQAFIVYPYIELEENDIQENVIGAVNEFKRLKSKIFPGKNIALIHGKLKPAEKDTVMNSFRKGKYDILVSTTVIEVGVDIPNASVMVIEGANRFGLAQLHQLRGRIGRGSNQSICFLIPETNDSITNARLTALQETNDGFKLADIDLQQRGPGDFLGYRQSGFKDLTLQNIMNVELIEKARTFAEHIFTDDPFLEKAEHAEMKKKLHYFWNETIGELN